MHPRETTYQLAHHPGAYRQAHELMRQAGVADQPLHFPTVLAYRGETLVGMLSCGISPNRYLILGPLVIHPDLTRPIWVIWRLIETMEGHLGRAGIDGYLFTVEKGHTRWLALLETVGLLPYTETDGHYWFQRKFQER